MRRSKPSSAIIHPERLPFSEAEVFEAFHLCFPIRFAKDLAREAKDAVKAWHWSRVRARYALAKASRAAEAINHGVVILQPGMPILLALLSEEHRARVQRSLGVAGSTLAKLGASSKMSFEDVLRIAREDLRHAHAAGREPHWVLYDLSDNTWYI